MSDSIQAIGRNAGKVWTILNEQGALTPADIGKKTGLTRTAVARATGWLAREGKLDSEDRARAPKLFLV